MTVRELISYLQTFNQDALVVLSKDAEGNSFKLLDGFDDDALWSDEENDIVDEEDSGGEPCVVLWPV